MKYRNMQKICAVVGFVAVSSLVNAGGTGCDRSDCVICMSPEFEDELYPSRPESTPLRSGTPRCPSPEPRTKTPGRSNTPLPRRSSATVLVAMGQVVIIKEPCYLEEVFFNKLILGKCFIDEAKNIVSESSEYGKIDFDVSGGVRITANHHEAIVLICEKFVREADSAVESFCLSGEYFSNCRRKMHLQCAEIGRFLNNLDEKEVSILDFCEFNNLCKILISMRGNWEIIAGYGDRCDFFRH